MISIFLRLHSKRLMQSLLEPMSSSLSQQITPMMPISSFRVDQSTSHSGRHDLSCTRSFASEPSNVPLSSVVQSPLQSFMHQPLSDASSHGQPFRQRTWLWYDSDDERKEQEKERKGLAERYAQAGYAKRLNVPQSQKKMDRVLKLVRGLRYEEAVHQLRLIPHKAGRIVIDCLEKAQEDALSKGLDERRLVVATLFGTKGQNETAGMIYMGKGFAAKKISHRTHITVALREAYTEEQRIAKNKNNKRARSQRHKEMSFELEAVEASVVGPIGRGRKNPKGVAFGARIVPPLMHPLSSPFPRFAPPPPSKDIREGKETSPDPLSLIPQSFRVDEDREKASVVAPSLPSPSLFPTRRSLQISSPNIKKKFDYRQEL